MLARPVAFTVVPDRLRHAVRVAFFQQGKPVFSVPDSAVAVLLEPCIGEFFQIFAWVPCIRIRQEVAECKCFPFFLIGVHDLIELPGQDLSQIPIKPDAQILRAGEPAEQGREIWDPLSLHNLVQLRVQGNEAFARRPKGQENGIGLRDELMELKGQKCLAMGSLGTGFLFDARVRTRYPEEKLSYALRAERQSLSTCLRKPFRDIAEGAWGAASECRSRLVQSDFGFQPARKRICHELRL